MGIEARPGLSESQISNLKSETLNPSLLKRTPLFAAHQKLGARLVEFGGWEMPVQYTSIVVCNLQLARYFFNSGDFMNIAWPQPTKLTFGALSKIFSLYSAPYNQSRRLFSSWGDWS